MEKLLKELEHSHLLGQTRRHFLKNCSTGLGMMAFGSLFGCSSENEKAAKAIAEGGAPALSANPMTPRASHFVPKAKRVIYLHTAGAPSQLDLFDYKPELAKLDGLDCPQSFLEGKRFAFIRGVPKMLGPQYKFAQHGQSGAWVSDLLPNFSSKVDEVTMLKAMHTDEFNHAPAQLLLQTGSARLGRPSMGAWVAYGLGTENDNLPGFIVLVSGGKTPSAWKSVWGSGFLPSVYQGVQCRAQGNPVLYVSNPRGMNTDSRRHVIDAINEVNKKQYEEMNDPEILSRISQYEMAFRMQSSVPEVMIIDDEPEYIKKMYGAEPGKASFANNCLLARRLAEKGVRFIQLYDWGWDNHGSSKSGSIDYGLKDKSRDVDQAMTALLTDLKARGMLEDTLVVWGGEFGRTPMRENRDGREMPFVGRDHHSEAFTVWMAGGGIKQGMVYGETDEMGYYGVKDKVHIHDLQATILNQLGLFHEELTYPYQGREFRLTDVFGNVVEDILA